MTPSAHTALELDSRFGIPSRAQIIAHGGGSSKIRVTTAKCTGEMHLYGAQITSWKPANTPEVIFLSSKAVFTEGKAIRGGIPICFPWFRAKSDDAHAPAHGFVRTKTWTLESIDQNAGAITVTMSTQNDPDTKRLWPHDFRAVLRATFGAELKLEFTVTNTGAAPFRFEEALHTYHTVGDIHKARIRGLDGVSYLDNTNSNRENKQSGDVAISGPTDSAYMNSQSAFDLLDPAQSRRIHIAKQNSNTTVIWNPWIEAAYAMADFGDDEWQQMLCAEAANIMANAVDLPAAKSHTLTVTMSVAQL
jgi:glucose-6-phosphate 1-epimerase